MTMNQIDYVPLESVRINGGTQSRVELNQAVIAEYAETIRLGTDLPPVVMFFDGANFWLADGFHRYHAHRQAGAMEIAAHIHTGAQRDAILYSVGANAAHGLRRTNDDKRRAVMTILADKEWATWSDNAIAKACHVSNHLVSDVRASLTLNSPSEATDARTYTTKHGTVATMNTAKIGKVEFDSTPAPANTEPAAEPDLESVEAEDHATPDLVSELEAADKEIRRLSSLIEQLTGDSDHAKVAAEWSMKFDQLSGRNAQLVRTLNEAQKQARYANDMLAKIRKALGVLVNADIIPALMARRMA
jgi:hypothetical protein